MNPEVPEAQPESNGCKTIAAFFVGGLVGFLVYLFASDFLIASVFGEDHRDSSSVWGLAGLSTVIVAIMTSPAYFLAYGFAFPLFRRFKRTAPHALLYSLLLSIPVGAAIACLYWSSEVGEKVLRAN